MQSCMEFDVPYFQPLANAAGRSKNDQEGVTQMCRIMEDHRDECIKRGLEQGQSNERRKVVQSLLKFMDPNTIAEKMGYPLEFIQKVAAET